MSSKIGILTFHCGPNYGGFMQAWHLREAVRSLGYSCDVINYLHPIHVASNKVKLPLTSLGALKARVHWYLKSRPFRSLENLLCDTSFAPVPSAIPWERYSALVVGSDVIWDFSTPRFGQDPVYFGSACPEQESLPIMSYAASCGSADISISAPDYFLGLKRFSAISVRDRMTAKFVEKITHRIPEIVADPTCLQEDPMIKCKSLPPRPYVLVYGGALDEQRDHALGRWARKQGLEVLSLASPCRSATCRLRSISPFEWVDAFRNAQAVVTGTFHGLLYAIKYARPFAMVCLPAAANKSQTVIDKFNLSQRCIGDQECFTDDFLNASLLHPCTEAAQNSKQWGQESMAFLGRSIQSMVSHA